MMNRDDEKKSVISVHGNKIALAICEPSHISLAADKGLQ